MNNTYKTELRNKTESTYERIIKEMPYFASDFFTELKQRNNQPLTILQYAYDIKLFFDWLGSSAGFKDVNLNACSPSDVFDKLTIDDIKEYLGSYEQKTIITDKKETYYFSDSFKARKASSLKSFLLYYYKARKINNDLSTLISVPTVHRKNHEAMTLDEVDNLFANLSNDKEFLKDFIREKRDYAIIMLFLGCGIRVSELVGINMDDIEFYEFNKPDEAYGAINITRKNGKEDKVYFGKSVKDALTDYIKNYRDMFFYDIIKFKVSKGNPASNPALFVSYGQRKRMSVRSVQMLVKKYIPHTNKKITPHTFRRTFATSLLNETGDIYLTSEALGHSSVQTTKLYAKISDERKRKAAAQSEKLFEKH